MLHQHAFVVVTNIAIGAVDSAFLWRNFARRTRRARHRGRGWSNEASFAIYTLEGARSGILACVTLATARHVVAGCKVATGAGRALVRASAVASRLARRRVQTASSIGAAFAFEARTSAYRRVKTLKEKKVTKRSSNRNEVHTIF